MTAIMTVETTRESPVKMTRAVVMIEIKVLTIDRTIERESV